MTETVQIQLTPEQEAAVKAAVTCLSGHSSENLTIGGYAGVGKTVLIKSIVDEMTKLGSFIAVTAFAGKAVSVLRKKGVYRAQTLHSLMYKPDKIDGKLTFSKLYDLECDGVIVDEASMINTALYEDLLSFGIPVVFVGDHGQLEPIGDNPGIMENPHVRLEKIHRQAEGSPILWLAHLFRQGKKPNWNSIPPGQGIRGISRREAEATCHEFDVVLCGFNKSRNIWNRKVRENRGYKDGPDLVSGERLICLKNDRSGFFNGQMFTVEAVHGEKRTYSGSGFVDCFEIDVKFEDGTERKKVTVWLAMGADSQSFPEFSREQGVIICDYGYALSVHKAQGSSWPKVLVQQEIWYEKWDWKRWTYTATTRAEKELAWIV